MPPGLILSPLLRSSGVPHAFTMREGGVSRGRFATLNFGNPMDLSGDDRDPVSNIEVNFGLVLGALGVPDRRVTQVYQVHGARAHVFRPGGPSRDTSPQGELDFKADALVTDDPTRAVAVRVADCAPVLLASADGRIVAAVHAGWRGVVAGVLPAAVGAMRELGATEINAAIGPCISAEAFEVGPEVIAEFRRVFGDDAPVRERADGKGYADLKEALRLQAVAAGVRGVDVLPHCTVGEPALFFSHRRDRGHTGRMIGVIAPIGYSGPGPT